MKLSFNTHNAPLNSRTAGVHLFPFFYYRTDSSDQDGSSGHIWVLADRFQMSQFPVFRSLAWDRSDLTRSRPVSLLRNRSSEASSYPFVFRTTGVSDQSASDWQLRGGGVVWVWRQREATVCSETNCGNGQTAHPITCRGYFLSASPFSKEFPMATSQMGSVKQTIWHVSTYSMPYLCSKTLYNVLFI